MKSSGKSFISGLIIRAVKTVAQTAIAYIGTAAAMGEVDWVMVASTSLLAGIISILTSLSSLDTIGETQESESACK